MKFDYVVGNPPFQEECERVSDTNKQNSRTNVFHFFQLEADKVAGKSSVLIYPGGRWLHQSGKGVRKFGKDLINDYKLAIVVFYPNANEVFPSAEIDDGISIVVKLANKNTPGFEYVYRMNNKDKKVQADNPLDDLMPLNPNDVSIVHKLRRFIKDNNLSFLHDRVLPRSLFGIESDFVEKHPDLVRPFSLSLSLS